MNEYPLQLFINLVSFDQDAYALEDKIEASKKEIEQLKEKEQELFDTLFRFEKNMLELRKEVDRAELDMKDLEQKEVEEKKRLDQVKNQKEFQAISQEIKQLKKAQHDYEETLLVAWNRFETSKKEYELQKKTIEEQTDGIKTTIEVKEKELGELVKDLDERRRDRNEKTKNIPEEWMEKYILMRSRVSDPVVSVVGGNCTSCFYNLPPQDFLELRRNKLIQCKGCYRFLYIPSQQD